MTPPPPVRVETVELDTSGSRQISRRRVTTALLEDRRPDIEAAIGQASAILRTAAENESAGTGWRVATIEATFGITLAAEAGVILSRASAEASLEIKLTIERA